jgi:Ca-activated chloride channel family protein
MKTTKPDLIYYLFRGFLAIILFLLTVRASAQELGDKSEAPYFFVISSAPGLEQLPLKSTRAEVNIAGVIADVTVTQEYKNDGLKPIEAVYTFPASTRAAVYAMEMVIGDRKIVARIEEKQKAREKYEEAKSEGKRTSLLEQQRPNVFQMNVANIMPGDLIKVTMRYTELLVPLEGVYKFIYPTVVGPRYTGEGGGGNNSFTNVPYTKQGIEPAYDFDIDLNLSMGMPIQHVASLNHKVSTTYPSTEIAKIELSPDEYHGGNRDFVLEYKLAGDAIESGLMLYEHGDENFFLLMVQPPKRIINEEIPPREYIFIVDVSGSMHGYPINVTKTLLRNLIVNLRPTDSFNVLVFESGAYWLADESVSATEQNIGKAASFLDQQQGGGGTNLLAAVKKAMSFPRKTEGLSRSFVVVTDGYVDVDKEVFDIIRTRSDEANVFAFGIGESVNRYLIEGMAHAGMSESFIVLGEEDANKQAEKFRRYINNPVLTQIKKSFSGLDAYDIEPLSIPDVLAERPVIIYGKYRGKAQGTMTVEGYAGKKKYKKSFNVSQVKADKKHEAIRYLWARKKIELLDDYGKLDPSTSVQQEVTGLGLRYNLLTAYTSFVAIEEKKVNSEKDLTTVKQPMPLPRSVENSAIGFELELDDDADFSFHKKIEFPEEFEKTLSEKIGKHIEANLMKAINKFLAATDASLQYIDVTVGTDGKAKVILFKGEISKKEMATIEAMIMKQLYAEFKIGKPWNYKIIFR